MFSVIPAAKPSTKDAPAVANAVLFADMDAYAAETIDDTVDLIVFDLDLKPALSFIIRLEPAVKKACPLSFIAFTDPLTTSLNISKVLGLQLFTEALNVSNIPFTAALTLP